MIQSSKGVALWKTLNISEKLLSVKHFHLVLLVKEMLELNGLLSHHFLSLFLLAKSAYTKFISLVRLLTFHLSLFFVDCMLCHADLV